MLLLFAASVRIQAQSPLVSIPFELFGDHIIIKLQVNNSIPLDFIFDTGDGLTVLDIDKARELDMPTAGAVKKTSAGGKVTGVLLKHQKIEILNEEIEEVEIYETSLLTLERTIGRRFDGIIGYDILKNYIVRVDYNTMKFELYDKKSNLKPKGTAFPLALNSYIPYIKGKFTLANGDAISGDFFIDTGAKAALDINSPFVDSNNLIQRIGRKYDYSVMGVGNKEILHYKGIAPTFIMGKFEIQNVPLGLSQAESGLQSNKKIMGIIGNEILKGFNITYDYAGKKIYFEKNTVFDDNYLVDASGLDFILDEQMENVFIHQVHRNSPAAAVGIQVDVQLLEVDGKAATSYTFPELREMFGKSGATRKLKIIQNGEILDVELTLQSLL